jgi:hypothetical protein
MGESAPLITAAATMNSYVASFDEITVFKFPVATTANTAVCTTMHDDTRQYKTMERATTRTYDKA